MTRGASNATLQRHFNLAWVEVKATLKKLHHTASILPTDANEVFIFDQAPSADEIAVTVRPIVLFVPEKASRTHPNMYVAIDGRIAFDAGAPKNSPRTTSFGTRVGYFRKKGSMLEHVYGTHYDMDEDAIGHPVFHSQMSSTMHMGQEIRGFDEVNRTDLVGPILSNVRVPTAQMDVFSTIEQVVADHLLWENSTAYDLKSFETLRRKCGFFTGSAYRVPKLSNVQASTCMRSSHWYP